MTDCAVIARASSRREEAARIRRTVVKQRLAACAQFLAIDRIYRWEGAVSVGDQKR